MKDLHKQVTKTPFKYMEKLMNFVFIIVITIFVFGLIIGLFAIITWTPFFGVLSFLKEAYGK